MRWKPLRRTAMILPLSVESPSKLSEAAQGDPEPMDVYEEDLNKAKSSGIFSGKAGKSSSASASAGATPPMLKSKSKAKPEKKAMPKLKVVDEGHGPSRQEFDTSILSPGSRVDRAGQHGRGAHQEGRLRQIECHLSLHVGVPPWASTFPSSTVARDSQVGPLDGPCPAPAGTSHTEVFMVVRKSPMRRFNPGQWNVIRHTSLDSGAHQSHPGAQKLSRAAGVEWPR